MKIGFKLYSKNWNYLPKLDFADFVEVLAIPKTSMKKFKDFKYTYTIHAAHSDFGFNPSDPLSRQKNIAILKAAQEAADLLNAKKIIVHPGFTNPELKIKDGVQNALAFFDEFHDPRFHFENIIYKEGDRTFFGYTFDETKLFLKKMKFCLDFGHAINAAHKQHMGYREYILKLYRLKPDYFHLSGNIVGKHYSWDTSHLSIFDGTDDIEFYKKLIKKRNRDVCLETPLDPAQRKKEYNFMKH